MSKQSAYAIQYKDIKEFVPQVSSRYTTPLVVEALFFLSYASAEVYIRTRFPSMKNNLSVVGVTFEINDL